MANCGIHLTAYNSILSLPGETVHEIATDLGHDFIYASTSANTYQLPSEIPENLAFTPAIVPGTITQLVSSAAACILDRQDHWLTVHFSTDTTDRASTYLQLAGLLTHAEVFLGDAIILKSSNAFHTHLIDITHLLKANNTFAICFRAIEPILSQKHPRAQFPTRLINQRNLRFIRTPPLGYMPGFASEAKLVGAFRPIKLIKQQQFVVHTAHVSTRLNSANRGSIAIDIKLHCLAKIPIDGYLLVIDEDTDSQVFKCPVDFQLVDGLLNCVIDCEIPNIKAYWPHTHGAPKRYLCKLQLQYNDMQDDIQLGRYGFRTISLLNAESFALQINHAPLFLRGACWTPMNPQSLQTTPTQLRQRLSLLKQAGINMLRLPGNMPYECDEFYEICDEIGILVMQDFAFANFDYPENNAEFVASVQSEAIMFLAKHGNRACLTVLAGNSEVVQQAAMMGIGLDKIHNSIFDGVLKKICAQYAPNVPYVNSSPNSNNVPFHVGNGTSHYYGVGGYKRSFEDARLFKGKFIAECLAFSHVPENSSLYQFFDNEFIPTHHPRWKEGVPRDNGAGWDFADISDFYLEKLFNVHVANLRAVEPQRYLDYCRNTSCEVVERTMNILRADSAHGRAALVWFLHDLKQGAGWGYIDSLGEPKSAFYGLARASQPSAILFVDEGLEGLAVYLAHDGEGVLDCQLEIALMTADGHTIEQQIKPCQLAPRSLQRVSVDDFLGRFVDSSYAYRFGARSFVACVAKLTDSLGEVICQRVYVDTVLTQTVINDVVINATCECQLSGDYQLTLSANRPVFFAVIELHNAQMSDNYVHIMPGYNVQIKVRSSEVPFGRVRAFNVTHSTAIGQYNQPTAHDNYAT
ncbi:MAG: hypothetical protein H7Z20_10280 [Bdellovibrio sp.]|nr:hypothetical protein [Methylotenera sp.]